MWCCPWRCGTEVGAALLMACEKATLSFNGLYLIHIRLPYDVWADAGVAQVLAGMWEFHVNNLFGATAFTSYGMFWLSFATLKQYILPSFKGMVYRLLAM